MAVLLKMCIRMLLRYRKCLAFLAFMSCISGMTLGIIFITKTTNTQKSIKDLVNRGIHDTFHRQFNGSNSKIEAARLILPNAQDNVKENVLVVNQKDKEIVSLSHLHSEQSHINNTTHIKPNLTGLPEPHYRVHIFYYPWYGNLKKDKDFIHWNHPYLPHWNQKEAKKWPLGWHQPPEDIGSNYYPSLGPYSSKDPVVLHDHMQQIRRAGIGVIAVSWYPPGLSDDNGTPLDPLMPLILDIANLYSVKVAFHIEPYRGRNSSNMKKNLSYIFSKYGSHPAFYRFNFMGKELPLFYVYDSYLTSASEWASILKPSGSDTLRGTSLDAFFIGLIAEQKHKSEIYQSGFDGFYTYFASEGFVYSSTARNWRVLKTYAQNSQLLFIPSVGPGYIDTRVRPWNGRNTKDRRNGGYYEQMFGTAISVKPPLLTITSFNEWHEGSQIEMAQPKKLESFEYLNYGPNAADFYLKLTKRWVDNYRKQVP